jgi:hypothetical protein
MWEEYPIVLPPSLLQHLASIGFTAEDLGGCFHRPPRVEELRELTFDRCAMCTCALSSSACVCLCKPLCCTRSHGPSATEAVLRCMAVTCGAMVVLHVGWGWLRFG